MSNKAITWALAQRARRSSDKFVLVVLANYANDSWISYPSQKRLIADTGLDRKTVIAALRRLSELGLIIDNGERKGRTKQIIVYRVGPWQPNTPETRIILFTDEDGTVPDLARDNPSSDDEQSQFSHERVPETGHGTFTEPTLKEPSAEPIELASARKTQGRSSHKQLKKTPLNETWVPSPDDRSFAEAHGLEADAQAELFKYTTFPRGARGNRGQRPLKFGA